ncbi:MAG: hypothetical protein ACKN89_00905 [Cyanobium sp.]
MAPRQRLRRAASGVALASTLLLAACSASGPTISVEGRARCQRRAQLEDWQLLRPLVFQHCLGTVEAALAEERREARQRRHEQEKQLKQAMERCRQQRAVLRANLAELRQAEQELARLRSRGQPPLPPPPSLPNEAVLRRYTREDAELDRQRFQESYMAWQQQLRQRQSLRQRHQSALDAAQLRLDRAALRLRQLQPDLLAKGIELDPAVAQRVLNCDRETLTAALSDALPASRAPR